LKHTEKRRKKYGNTKKYGNKRNRKRYEALKHHVPVVQTEKLSGTADMGLAACGVQCQRRE